MIIESKVGSKGELFLTKVIRKKLGWKPGDVIFFEIKGDKLIVQKVPDLLEFLKQPPIGEPETPEEIENDLENFFSIQLRKSVENNE